MFSSNFLNSTPVALEFLISGFIHIYLSRRAESRQSNYDRPNLKLRLSSWSRIYINEESFRIFAGTTVCLCQF